MVDANNLYAGVIEKFPIPLRYFELANELSLGIDLNTSNDSPLSFILGVALEYPDSLQKLYKEFTLALRK